MTMTLILFKLLYYAVISRRDVSILLNRITILGLTFSCAGGFVYFLIWNKGVGLQSGLIFSNSIGQMFHIFIFLLTILILQSTSFFPRKFSDVVDITPKFSSFYMRVLDKIGEQFKLVEYPLLILFIITGAVLLMATNDFFSVFLSIELQSYGLYLVCSVYRNSELATASGLIYFLIGGLSSCFILLSISLLYSNSGASCLDSLLVINNVSEANNVNDWYLPYYLNFSLLILSIGFLIKIGAAPFHFWSPDVYDGLPTIVTSFVAIIGKISLLIFLFQIVFFIHNNVFEVNWTYSILLSSLFSLIIGSVIGLTQFRIKRLLAYSTISHLGFILLALAISSVESFQAFLFYLVQYSFSNMNIFIIIIALGFSLFAYRTSNIDVNKLMDKQNSPLQLIKQVKGYFNINPTLSICFAITIFSFIGIPPLIGFFGKQLIFSSSLDKGYYFFIFIAISASVIGAGYYLNIIKETFFYNTEYYISTYVKNKLHNFYVINVLHKKKLNIINSSSYTFTISNASLIILLFLYFNKDWLSLGSLILQKQLD